jgi:hypothetical protein
MHRRSVHFRVLIAHRRQSDRAVLLRVFLVADPDHRLLEQADDRGEHFFARQAALAEVGAGALADLRQRLGEGEQPSVLHLVARVAPPRVIAVLLAAARVAPGRLHVAARIGADPDVGPRRRDRERVDALNLRAIGDGAAARVDIAESAQAAQPPDAGRALIADVAQAGGLGGVGRRRRRAGRDHRAELAHDTALAALVPPQLFPRARQTLTTHRSRASAKRLPPVRARATIG